MDTSVHANSHRVSVRSARRQKNGLRDLSKTFSYEILPETGFLFFMGHLYSLHVPLKNHTHNTCFSVSNFYTFQNNHPATACWILIIAIHPLLASLGVARAPYRAPAGQITCFSTILVIDPPRGLPAGGGGTARSWGCGGDSPHDIPATQSGNPARDPANLPEKNPPPLSKKSVTPLPPRAAPQKNRSDRSISKSVGATSFIPVSQHALPLDVQERRGDRSDRF